MSIIYIKNMYPNFHVHDKLKKKKKLHEKAKGVIIGVAIDHIIKGEISSLIRERII